MKPHTYIKSLALLGAVFSVSCGGGGGGGSTRNLQAQMVADNLSFPTALRFTPEDDIIFTEKGTGNVRRIVDGLVQPGFLFHADVNSDGERGLLGLALDPSYETNHFVYLFYTKSNGTENTVVRFTDDVTGPDTTVIVPSLPAASTHNGGRLEFGPDGKLYVTLGENGNPANSQNNGVTPGKVLRYNPDGSVPNDNPIPGNPLYTIGHRNCFGLAIDQASGQVFVSENGPDCDDEVNRLIAGENYGWRPGQPCGDTDDDFELPLRVFENVIAPTGITVGTGAYANSLLMASFNDSSLRQIHINNFPTGTLGETNIIYTAPGGEAIIDVTMGPDGNPYVATSGRILRLVP
jgi:aldose sugar dehydrogenase